MVTDPSPKSFVVHANAEILYADEMFLNLIGADSRDQVIGRKLTEFVEPEFRGPLTEQIELTESGDAPALGLQLSLRTETDRSRDVIALNSKVDWRGGERIQTSFLKVSDSDPDRGLTLRDYAIDEAPIGITMANVTEPDEPLIYVNDGFVEMTGYPREEAIGRNCRFLQGEATREAPIAEMRAAIESETSATVELRNYRKDGSLFWNRVSIVPIESHSGDVTHYLGFQQDITDTKLFEREKTLFEKQAEYAEQAIFITDREGVIEYVNPAFERTTGYSADDAIGQTPRILNSGKHDDHLYEDLWDTITAGDIWKSELTNQRKDGELYEVKQTIVPITDDSGVVTHFAAIESDITNQMIREQTLTVLNRVLRHNLRAAITVIEGQAEMLDPDREYSNPRAAITAIKNQTESMEKIADKTASIQRLWEREGEGTVWGQSELRTLIEEYRTEYPEARIHLTIDIDEEIRLPDIELFELAFDEAIENAVTYTEAATPEIEIAVERLADSSQLCLAVADEGPGIPSNELKAIEAGEELPLTHGTGIGLWIMKWVTTGLGGEFEITDNEPRGTVLRFHLPEVS